MESGYQSLYFKTKELKHADIEMFRALQFFLQKASDRCYEKTFNLQENSYNTPNWEQYGFDGFIDDPDKQNMTLIIVEKDFYKQHILDIKTSITNGSLFDHTLGHVHLTWDKKLDICALWDVCKHFKNVPIKGGSILIETILDGIHEQIANTTLLWLGVDFRNTEFIKVCSLYARFGFHSPYISTLGPFKNLGGFPFGLLCLSRKNKYMDEDDIYMEETMTEINYVVGQYLKLKATQVDLYGDASKQFMSDKLKSIVSTIIEDHEIQYSQQSCHIGINIPINTVKRLYRLISFSTYNPLSNTVTQKEISGSFYVTKVDSVGKNLWELKVESTKECIGSEAMVMPTATRYNFHTHTFDTYERDDVQIAFPSGNDWPGFLDLVLRGLTSLHFVITREGIYLLELNEFWCGIGKLDILRGKLEAIAQKYFILNKGIYQPWTELMKNPFQLDRNLPFGKTPIEGAHAYVEEINRRLFDDINVPIFRCRFFPWEDLIIEENNSFYANIPVNNGQCFLDDEGYKSYEYFELGKR